MLAEKIDKNIIKQAESKVSPRKSQIKEINLNRSPIKTPRSIDKSHIIQSKILGRANNGDYSKLNFEKPNDRKNINLEKNCKIKSDDEKLIIQNNKKNNIILENMKNIIAPRNYDLESNDTYNNDNDDQYDHESYKKKKKDWKSWSSQEKELFYEAIANGGNYTSLQKLFKTMNDKIGTKSTEKIRDYYYRALKNVNKLLRSVGDSGINRKNRDEVIHALNCYGKMITSSNSKKKSNLDAMKKLNRHPRLFKKTALSLKKVIMKGVKSMRNKKHNNNKYNKIKNLSKNVTFKKEIKIQNSNGMISNLRVIDPDIGRRFPYERFVLKLTPFDHETYFKMIECNYNSRFEISITYNKSLKQLIETLTEKWKNIVRKYKDINLYLCPIEEIWIPSEITFFSSDNSSKSYDLGDIYTAYGCPSTNVLLMHYQWAKTPLNIKKYSNSNIEKEPISPRFNDENLQSNQVGNSLLAHPTINNENSPQKENSEDSQVNMDDLLNSNSGNDSDDDKEKSLIALEQDYDEFDPLEFLGIYKSKNKINISNHNSSEDDDYDINKILDDEEFYEINNLRKISPSSNKSVVNEHIFEKNHLIINNENNCLKKENEDFNDPYGRFNFIGKIKSENKVSNLNLSDSFNSTNNIFMKHLNNNYGKNINMFSDSESNFNNSLNLSNTELSKMLLFQDPKVNAGNATSKVENNNDKSNENSSSAAVETRNKRRISFQNNFTNDKKESSKKIESTGSNEKKKTLTPEKEKPKVSTESSKNISSNENYLTFNNKKSNETNKDSSNLFKDRQIINSFNQEKNSDLIFNGENSNMFNNTNFNNIGIFDQESTMNLMKNYNNSMLFGEYMFNSNHLNSNFMCRNIEDSMMKKIEQPLASKEQKDNNLCNLIRDDFSFNHSNSIKNEEKDVNTITNLNKKSKRSSEEKVIKSKKAKSAKNNPVNLDDVLEREAKEQQIKNKSKTKKEKEKMSSEKTPSQKLPNEIRPNYHPQMHGMMGMVNPHFMNYQNSGNFYNANVNPFIINQNNYFNGMRNDFPPQNNLDIPHPNSLIQYNNIRPSNEINYQMNNNIDMRIYHQNNITGNKQIPQIKNNNTSNEKIKQPKKPTNNANNK